MTSTETTPSLLKLLNELSICLQALVDAENFHQSILNTLKSKLRFEGVQYWSIPAVIGREEGVNELDPALSPRDSVLAYVFQKKQSLILSAIPSEVRASSALVSAKTASLLAAPVMGAEKDLLGILVVESANEDAFSEDDRLFFEALTKQLAAVLRSRELLREAKEGSRRLEFEIQEKSIELKRAQERISDQQKEIQRENKVIKTLVDAENRGQEFIGESPATQEILAMVDKVAPTLATVLILGESGTGKELVARRIHQKSARANAPYVTVNCAALQESLLESELFGHERGSFTGAVATKVGLCEAADGGTLFMDEIGEMSLQIQTKMLRFLQEGEFYRIGGKKPIQVSVRIVSATNRDLAAEVAAGRFREDLFYRLNTIAMKMPPLRTRKEDIPLLCDYFLKNSRFGGTTHVKRFDPRVIEVFQNYSWPGNIRELQNTVERLKILSEGPTIQLEDIPFAIRMPKETPLAADFSVGTPLEEVEKGHILRTLAFNHGNKTKTAQALGITIKTLYNKLHRYGAVIGNDASDAATESKNL